MVNSETILVTGAAGFIGSHTCEELLRKGNRIIGLDNLNEYYDLGLKRNNLRILQKYEKFEFLELDIRNYDNLQNMFKKHDFKAIIHLAAQAGVRFSLKNPSLCQQVNIGGTLNLLELTRLFKINKFIFASSSSVYGNQKKFPFSEDDPVNHPISIYAATKQAGESLCYSYHHLYDLRINCLRLFTVYGPRGRPDMSPHIFTQKILNGKEIKLYEDPPGSIQRDFTYITDTVEGIIRSVDFEDGFQIFNLGYGSSIKLLDFLSILENLTGKDANIKYYPRQPGDINITFADISKAKQYLSFNPKISFEKGLKIFLEWFKYYYNTIT